MGNSQFPDLQVTQYFDPSDKNYFNTDVKGLTADTLYGFNFQWVFEDEDLNAKYNTLWSNTFLVQTIPLPLAESTDIVATWVEDSLQIVWKSPTHSTGFQIELTGNVLGTPRTVYFGHKKDVTTTNQKMLITREQIMANFGNVFQTTLSGFLRTDYINAASVGVVFSVPVYSDPVCSTAIQSSDWSVTSIDKGATVSWSGAVTLKSTYKGTLVFVGNLEAGPFVQAYEGKGPATLKFDDFNLKYIKIQHLSYGTCSGVASSVKSIKAFDSLESDKLPPDPIVNPVGSWSGRNLVVSFDMPAANPPTSVKVFLTYSGNTKHFEKYLDVTTGSTSVTITENEIIGQFAASPSSFTSGYVTDLDIYRNENFTQVPITGLSSVTKPNFLSGITTTISVSPMANGYVVSSTFNKSATGIEIYQSATENGTYTLVASSGSSPVVVYDEVSSGNEVWVKGRWNYVDGFANMSLPSKVLILDVGALSLIENPVTFATLGSIFTGDLNPDGTAKQSGARGVFNKRGLFFYDADDTNGTNATTQIIGDASSASPTFITTRAKIADWMIYPGKIENTLHAGTDSYTGLSPSGTYAFWAGAGETGGYSANINKDAKFSVTKGGSVIARDINVLGGSIRVGGLTDSVAPFTVNSSGIVKMVDATVNGTINATTGVLGDITIGGPVTKIVGGVPVTSTIDGQITLITTGGKIEFGKLKNQSGTPTGQVGIQGTNGANQYFQLDTIDGIVTKKGKIGGWEIDANSINSSNQIGLYHPDNPTSSDVMIWAGGTRTDTATKFKVTYGGKVTATDVDLTGKITAVSGFFGQNATNTNIKGFEITGTKIQSVGFSAGTSALVLDGETGEISGGKIIANSFKTSPTAGTNNALGVKIDSTGFYGYDGTKASVAIATSGPKAGKLIAYEAEIYGDFRAGDSQANAYILNTGDFRIGSETQYISGSKTNMIIKMGSYTIQDTTVGNVNHFQIIGENNQDILKVSSVTDNPLGGGTYGDDPQPDEGRLYLGSAAGNLSKARQVQVRKSAQVSGSSENYLSGGLRNIFTMEETYWNTSRYASAGRGDVVFVYKAGS